MNKTMAGGLLFLIATSACNHTPTTQSSPTPQETIVNGIAPDNHPHYYLPIGQLSLKVTRSLDCAKTTNIASIGWEVSATVKVSADKKHPIPLTLDALNHFGRDVEAAVHFAEDGRITGINVNSKDQIGPTIASVFGSLTKIGISLATINTQGVAGFPKLDDKNRVICKKETADLFHAMRGMSEQIKGAEKRRALLATELGKVTPGSPGHDEVRKKLAAIDKSIGQFRSELAKLLAPYKHTKSIEYVPEMLAAGSEKTIDAIPSKVTARWLGGDGQRLPTGGTVKITPIGQWAGTPQEHDGTKFLVRMPGTAKVEVETTCIVPDSGETKTCKATEVPLFGLATVFSKELALPQAGRLLAVNLDSSLFRDKIVDIKLHSNGTLKSYGTTEKSGMSGVSNALTGLQQSVDAYSVYRAAREADDKGLNEMKDENALLEEQIKNLENKKKLEALQAEQATSESAD